MSDSGRHERRKSDRSTFREVDRFRTFRLCAPPQHDLVGCRIEEVRREQEKLCDLVSCDILERP